MDTRSFNAHEVSRRPVSDPRIREHALTLLESEHPFRYAVAGLLAHNTHPDDITLLSSLLEECTDDDTIEDFSIALWRYLDVNPTAPVVPLLLRLFEKTACSVCRAKTVDALQKRNALPPEILAECRWDCNPDTREQVSAP